MSTSTRYIGNCQICEGDFKLQGPCNDLLVHHGYKRPGHGSIVGDCPAVGELPYELSCDILKVHVIRLREYLAGQEEFLRKLKAGEITRMYVSEHRSFGKDELVEYVAGVTAAHRFTQAIERKTWEAEANIRHAKHDIERCTKRIADWKADADKAARKAEKDITRAARAAKVAATQAKQDALKAKRQAILDDFATKFRALAAQPETEARHEATYKLCETVKLKKSHSRAMPRRAEPKVIRQAVFWVPEDRQVVLPDSVETMWQRTALLLTGVDPTVAGV